MVFINKLFAVFRPGMLPEIYLTSYTLNKGYILCY